LRPPEAAANGASGVEREVAEHRLDARVHLPRAGRVERVVQPVELAQRRVRVLDGHAVARLVVAGEQPPGVAEPRGDDVERRARARRRDVLLEPRDGRPALAHHLARVGRARAVEQLHERALAGAVAAEQADALAALDGQRRAVEHGRAAEGDGDVLETEECHAAR
jgi:hypothetical protein